MSFRFLLCWMICTSLVHTGYAQDMKKFHLYDPLADGRAGLTQALQQATKEKKHVLVQIGGNWCVWCARLHAFITEDKQIDSLINSNYIVYHLNYSKENRNPDILKDFGYPQRFGFPVLLILDAAGNRLHTQNSSYLEEGKSYNREKLIAFLNDWSPAALSPEQYQNY